jgi:hypothetical protein
MNDAPDTDIRRRARRSYERARAANALALGAIVAAPALFFSVKCCPTPAASLLCGLVLGSSIAIARFAGRGFEAALRPGLAAGAIAFVFPLACHGLMACPQGMCMSPRLRWLPLVAVAAGLLGGMVIRLLFRGGSPLVAGLTALMLGSLGSLVVGFLGPAWTAMGLAAGALIPLRRAGREA